MEAMPGTPELTFPVKTEAVRYCETSSTRHSATWCRGLKTGPS